MLTAYTVRPRLYVCLSQLIGYQFRLASCVFLVTVYPLCFIAVVEGGLAQAVPEHPKRENIFSLSTAFGDAYLFQVIWLSLPVISSRTTVILETCL